MTYLSSKLSAQLPIAILFMVSILNSGCLLSYLVKSGYHQANLLLDREPIEKVLDREHLDPKVRHKLELTLAVQKFARERLQLKTGDNYKTFVNLNRPYVTYIVMAAHKDRLQSHEYWYPLYGKMPYRGYFSQAEAEKAAHEFDKNNYDVMVRGVSAYSTLGWFADPLLSSMLEGEDHHLVNIIIHESTHATIFIKNQVDFNEQLATYIGQIGTEIFYRESHANSELILQQIAHESHDELLFSKFISDEIDQLKQWYTQNAELYKTDKNEFLNQRELQFKKIQTVFAQKVEPHLKTKMYSRFKDRPLNNANLLHYKTYMNDLTDFENAFRHFKNDFHRFIAFAKSLESAKDPRAELQKISSPNSH